MQSAGPEEVVPLIYDAALDPTVWPVLLRRLAGMFNCHFADRFQRTTDFSHCEGIPHGLDQQDYDNIFIGSWANRNVWGQRRPVWRAGDVLTTREMVPAEELRRSEMYTQYLDARSLHEGMRLDLWASDGWIEDMSFLRPWSAGPYSSTEVRMARTLLPHLQRSAKVARRLRIAEASLQSGLATLEHLHTAVLLLDAGCRVIRANSAASALLASEDGLAAGLGGLVAATPDATRRMQALIHMAIGRAGVPAASGAMQLPRRDGRPPLALVALPLRPEGGAHLFAVPGAPAALLCITDPLSGVDLRLHQLVDLFGLTQSEARLALELLSGLDLAEIAERNGRSINTVRTQLARLMDKTDTNRQAELMRLLTRLPRDSGE